MDACEVENRRAASRHTKEDSVKDVALEIEREIERRRRRERQRENNNEEERGTWTGEEFTRDVERQRETPDGSGKKGR